MNLTILIDSLKDELTATAELGDERAAVVGRRLAGQEPELVFVDEEPDPGAVGDDLSARITLRLPEGLKGQVEAAAAREGVSVNTWLVRALARAVESRPRSGPGGHGRRLTGYGRS